MRMRVRFSRHGEALVARRAAKTIKKASSGSGGGAGSRFRERIDRPTQTEGVRVSDRFIRRLFLDVLRSIALTTTASFVPVRS